MKEAVASSVLIIGAGQAGYSAGTALRKLGFAGDITLVGEEGLLPYQRPPLSKAFLLREFDADRLSLRPAAFYSSQNIGIFAEARAERIDRSNKIVRAGEQNFRYDHLILATGSRARRLGVERGDGLPDVHYLRTQRDATSLGSKLEPRRRLLVVGGGYIGLEVAAVAATLGLHVTVLESADRILQRIAAKATSNYFSQLHHNHGVEVREGIGVARFCGRHHLSAAVLTDGSQLDVDVAVVGVGIQPNIELAQECGLDVENGIRVDEFGLTSDPNIWAVGDCCSFPHEGMRVRLESVPHAIEQAEAVAANIMGQNAGYVARPWFWSDQYNVKLQIAGLNSGFDQTIERSGDDLVQKSVWYFRKSKLLAVDAMNDARSYVIARRMLEKGYSPSLDQVADASLDLRTLL
jgi:3-phenylpropionate/trans-cinnamate dioxygenase ferredoxin reductase subunit